MKKMILLTLGLFLFSCQKNKEIAAEDKEEVNYASFGDSISAEGALTKADLLAKYEALQEKDTIEVKFVSSIQDVCQKKGCWMNMDLSDDKKTFVRFKDYGFFMPLNAAGSEAIVEGKAFIEVVSVDELKHIAKDAGKSQEAIDSIKEPKTTYAFTANGVLIKE